MKACLLLIVVLSVMAQSNRVIAQDDFSGATLSLGGTGTGILPGFNDYAGGIGVVSSCGTETISAPVSLGASSTWTVSGTTSSGLTITDMNPAGGVLTVSGTISGGSGTLTLSGANTFVGSSSIGSGTLTLNDTGAGTVTWTPVLLLGTNTTAGGLTLSPNGSGITVAVAPIPEPSTWALLFGSLAGLAIVRRLRFARR